MESNTRPENNTPDINDEMFDCLQKETFDYFLHEADPTTGLIADSTKPGSPSSIAATGMALSCYIIGIENRLLTRNDAAVKVFKILDFFYNSPQGTAANATGYKGFYYHFLDMKTGERAWNSELSTIDTALFIAGVLSTAAYFGQDNKIENTIRDLADKLYRRVDWQWALNKEITLTHGWRPRRGFLKYRWNDNYNEAIILYILALGSPTYPIDSAGYRAWTDSFKLERSYDIEYIYAGPLFIHQFTHLWIDFRGIFDGFNKKAGFDYFENSRRATYVHRQYAIENLNKYAHYGPYCWGLTASDGPGRTTLKVNGRKRTFYNYIARGAPHGPDDGTVSPWAVVASLPFAPEIVIETVRHAIENFELKTQKIYGFDASFNPTYPEKTSNKYGWVSPWKYGLNQAPIIIMIENYKTGMIWELMKRSPYIVRGLKAAGFEGGWIHPVNGQ